MSPPLDCMMNDVAETYQHFHLSINHQADIYTPGDLLTRDEGEAGLGNTSIAAPVCIRYLIITYYSRSSPFVSQVTDLNAFPNWHLGKLKDNIQFNMNKKLLNPLAVSRDTSNQQLHGLFVPQLMKNKIISACFYAQCTPTDVIDMHEKSFY